MRHQVRDLIKQRIINYLENECCFRDYEFRTATQFRDPKYTRAATINLLRPTEAELDDALNVFSRDGYREILIYI